MKKTTFCTEFAYPAGLVILALGTALMEYGGFGISMVAAPSYVLYLKVSEAFPAFGFGASGYLVEALILLVMMAVIRQAKLRYLLSFVTAVTYGLVLDGIAVFTRLLPRILPLQAGLYIIGVLLCSAAISLLFHSYFPPAAHEMFVKEVAFHKEIRLSVLKTVYDCGMLLIALLLSLGFFGVVRGIGIGTVVCAFINGSLIRLFSNLFEKFFIFRDKLPLRSRFEDRKEIL